MEPAVDLSLHAARPATETLLIANSLIASTATQLNTFASRCEEKLLAMHHKMLRLETGVKLLEAKLNSLPEANATDIAPPPPPVTPAAVATAAAAPPAPPPAPSVNDMPPPPATSVPPPPPEAPAMTEESPDEPKRKMKDDPRFAKYYKMEKFGVPKPVVIMKFQQETGMDPALLDTPDAPAPPGGTDDEDEADSD